MLSGDKTMSTEEYERLVEERRMVKVELNPEDMVSLCRKGAVTRTYGGVPLDAYLVDAKIYDINKNFNSFSAYELARAIRNNANEQPFPPVYKNVLIFAHESFEAIPDGVALPEIRISITSRPDDEQTSN
jgi:hypothetical protein